MNKSYYNKYLDDKAKQKERKLLKFKLDLSGAIEYMFYIIITVIMSIVATIIFNSLVMFRG